ncbi:thioesterase [Achromobacter sp. Root83]|uniref:thioesterase II family protein n=1 Tax=Achromobacter sp. Root83 TaxID=1736602 RepID=UPI000708C075|nr:alpha/beta fold hydrolase [Achromobacter sp. Root83]KRC86376.1 thioesterase [Achromobacter sp. Root83]
MTPAVTLLCLPCAGASATMYLRWRRVFPAWIRVEPVELPGRGLRMAEPFMEDFDSLVAHLCALHARAMQGRYALFGHSLGGLLAYGMTRHQRATGGPLPLAMLASASPAPSRRRGEAYPAKGDDRALLADLHRQGGTPQAVFDDPELIRLTLDALGSDYRLCESFAPAPSPGVPVPLHVFAGRDDDIGEARIQAWREEAGDVYTLDWFEGGHFYFREREAEVLAAVRQRLELSLTEGRHGRPIPA